MSIACQCHNVQRYRDAKKLIHGIRHADSSLIRLTRFKHSSAFGACAYFSFTDVRLVTPLRVMEAISNENECMWKTTRNLTVVVQRSVGCSGIKACVTEVLG